MSKHLKRMLCLISAVAMLLCAVGCTPDDNTTSGNNKNYKYDPETRPMTFAVGALDGNFNPFFYSSANDGSVIAMTQIGMMTTNSAGDLVCGDDYATVSLINKITMIDENGNETDDGENAKYTDYEFVIKNGIKFSDGEPLTIKDVLFNLYVYLDPMYTGSSTIYSTDIVGLKAYRAQDKNLGDDEEVDFTEKYRVAANQRINNLVSYLDGKTDLTDQIAADIEFAKKTHLEELYTDWTTVAAGGMESYQEKYRFTELWEAYLFNEGIVSTLTKMNGQGAYVEQTDENGKYLTTLDEETFLKDEMDKALSQDKIQKYMQENGCSEEIAKEALMKEAAVSIVYSSNTGSNQQLKIVVTVWATGQTMLEDFIAEEMDKDNSSGEMEVPNISGITTYKTSTFNGTDLGEEHDVLKIRINGIDPKAIWNFSFTVAPMHYYSNEEQIALYDGVSHFGVAFRSKSFFDDVLKSTEKNGLPVGAGVYKASDASGNTNVSRNEFYKNNYVYFTRNDNFETVGKNINNAHIRLFRYRVVSTDNLLTALKLGEIDYGEPNAKPENINKLEAEDMKHLGYQTYKTGGYGYVGINPKFIEDIEVRQAIMKAMNTATIIKNYYGEKLGELIYRPMSITSWAYPSDVTEPYYTYTQQAEEIQALVEKAGWKLNKNGKYEKNGKTLKITFTIAGDSQDHPARYMFEQAAAFLNTCGFDITVTTDINALKKLTTGGLEVWAAAWSSAADPDMYQNYHKDSTATALKNWYCQGMLNDQSDQFTYEKTLIQELADLIEDGRKTNSRDERAAIYAEALEVVMKLAIELPTYQRNDLAVYNTEVIDVNTLNSNASFNEGVVSKIWEVDYN